jgi:hypothetical protein
MSKKKKYVEVETQFSLSRSQVLSLYTLMTTAASSLRRVDEDLSDEIRKNALYEMFEDFLSTPTAPMDPVVRSIERSIRKAADLAFASPNKIAKSKTRPSMVDENTYAQAVVAEADDATRVKAAEEETLKQWQDKQ